MLAFVHPYRFGEGMLPLIGLQGCFRSRRKRPCKARLFKDLVYELTIRGTFIRGR